MYGNLCCFGERFRMGNLSLSWDRNKIKKDLTKYLLANISVTANPNISLRFDFSNPIFFGSIVLV